jgi:hypothetical protein
MTAISARDGHFLAGLIEAEACFQIRPNNGGANWACNFMLALRRDDAGLLSELHERTKLGAISAKPARANSKPQAVWAIHRRAECLRLAELLEEFPLRGRKSREVEVWATAVRELDRTPRPDALPQLAAEIRSLKRYVNSSGGEERPAPPLDNGLVAYLGGLFTGEGHLSLSGLKPRVALKLRADDRPLLEDLSTATGLGRLYSASERGRDSPSVTWLIYRHDQLTDAASLLRRARLRGRKARDFALWRPAALEVAGAAAAGRRADTSVMSRAHDALQEGRQYKPVTDLDARSPRERQAERCVRALRRAASATSGHVTVTAYSHQRREHPDWPNRDTITRVFGTWSEALSAAGLAARCGGRARVGKRDPGEFTLAELERRRVMRRRVVAVVARLAVEHGGAPGIHDYLAWRTEHDASLPCLAKVYDLFPGGWSSVVARLKAPRSPARTSPRGTARACSPPVPARLPGPCGAGSRRPPGP